MAKKTNSLLSEVVKSANFVTDGWMDISGLISEALKVSPKGDKGQVQVLAYGKIMNRKPKVEGDKVFFKTGHSARSGKSGLEQATGYHKTAGGQILFTID